MFAPFCSLQLDIWTLAGKHLGTIAVAEAISALDLSRQVHVKFPPPPGSFWKLDLGRHSVSRTSRTDGTTPIVHCVAVAPTQEQEVDVVNMVTRLLDQGLSSDDLDPVWHSIWTAMQSLTFAGAFNQSLEEVTLPSGLQNLTFGDNF